MLCGIGVGVPAAVDTRMGGRVRVSGATVLIAS